MTWWLSAGTPREELATVRSTVTVIRDGNGAAEQETAPGRNTSAIDVETDGGLTTHTLASHVVPSVRTPPPLTDATDLDIINDQISSAGVAPKIERAGRWGHGTVAYAEGIEPAIDGTRFAETYFDVGERITPSLEGVEPLATDPILAGALARSSADAARAAVDNSLYAAFLARR